MRSWYVPWAAVVYCLTTLPVTAAAEHPDIAAAANQVSLGVGQLRMNYKEFNDGLTNLLPSVLDSENGRLASAQLGASALLPFLYGDLRFTITHGETTYNGYLQDLGPPVVYTPYVGKTSNTIASLYGRIGYPFRPASKLMLIPVIEAGEYFWRRDLGYTEDYSHLLVGIGAKALWTPLERLVVDAGASYGTTLFANMHWNGNDYELDSKPYLAGQIVLDYRIAGRWHLRLSGEYRKWQYGQSPVVAGFLEPRSETVQVTKLLSVGYSFAR